MKKDLTVLISGAMECETDLLIGSLEGAVTETVDGFLFRKGRARGKQVIVCRTRMGKTNAALATYIGIKRYFPDVVINQGTAGAHDISLDVGDIVLARKMVNVDSFKTPSTGRGEGYSISSRGVMNIDVYRDGSWEETDFLYSDGRLVEKAVSVPYRRGTLRKGCVGTGDGFNRERDAILAIRRLLGTDCEEMETFSAAQTASHLGVPFLGVRVISNSELKKKSFDGSTGAMCMEYCLDLIEAL